MVLVRFDFETEDQPALVLDCNFSQALLQLANVHSREVDVLQEENRKLVQQIQQYRLTDATGNRLGVVPKGALAYTTPITSLPSRTPSRPRTPRTPDVLEVEPWELPVDVTTPKAIPDEPDMRKASVMEEPQTKPEPSFQQFRNTRTGRSQSTTGTQSDAQMFQEPSWQVTDKLLDEAIQAVQDALSNEGTEAEWLAALARPLVSASQAVQISRVLQDFGWIGTEFVSTPDRELLLQRLQALKAMRSVRGPNTTSSMWDVEDVDTALNGQSRSLPQAMDFIDTERTVKVATYLEYRDLRPVWLIESDLKQRIITRMSAAAEQEERRSWSNVLFNHRIASLSSRTRSTDFFSMSARPFYIMEPESRVRFIWDMCAVCLLAYDAVVLPLQLFEFGRLAVRDVMNRVIAIYWTIDILASCITGQYINGYLVMAPVRIICRYAKSWMLFDLAVVSFDWFMISADDGEEKGMTASLSSVRGLKYLRFIRMLRLVKVQNLLDGFKRVLNSPYLELGFRIATHLVSLVFVNHIFAGIWYAIGNSTSEGWVDRYLENREASYRYVTALHWSLTQFHGTMEVVPQTTAERYFGVCVVLIGLIAFTVFVSNMTQLIFDLHSLHAEHAMQHRLLCNFLRERNISRVLTARVKSYLRYVRKNSETARQEEANLKSLSVLPRDILMDLYEEARIPMLLGHSLFRNILDRYPRALRHIVTESMTEIFVGQDEVLFAKGDACARALVIEFGTLIYVQEDVHNITDSASEVDRRDFVRRVKTEDPNIPRQFLFKRRWISEACLWTPWECCGSCASKTNALILEVWHTRFADVITQYEKAYVMAAQYATRWIDRKSVV